MSIDILIIKGGKRMEEEREDILARILNLCEADPDAGLEFVEQTIKDKPESESDPFGNFAKAMAYGSKGLFQFIRNKPSMDFTRFNEEELRDDIGISDMHLDYLEKGIQEIKKMEDAHLGALTLFGTEEDRFGESRVDAMSLVLERCRPGSIQKILGKTKLKYFGPERILYVSSGIGRLSPEDFRVLTDIYFEYESIVRTAIIIEHGIDYKGRRYMYCGLFKRTPDNAAPGETLGETLLMKGSLSFFDDGTTSSGLPQKYKPEYKKAPDKEIQPKRKGFLGRLFN